MTRPRLNAKQLKTLASKMRRAFKWDADPKDFQLAAVQAQIEGVDMIVQAPTGSGKTALAAGPHLWPGNERKFTLMVCPLLSLEEEMVQTFKNEFGLNAVALNSANGACSPLVIKDILAMKYQIILISPEMVQSRMFLDRILRNTQFMRNIISMFVDEAHCIAHWGAEFRKKYGSLGKVRVFFPRGTPVIAVTATLTAQVRRTIHHALHFSQSEAQSRFINKGNDRPNVSIVVRACEHPLNSFMDLGFVIPPRVRNPADIPKTYIYVDNIAVGGDILDYLNNELTKRWESGTPSPGITGDSDLNLGSEPQTRTTTARSCPNGLIRPFNATLSQEYRSLAMAHFRQGTIRVLVCTDAAGMGCNIPDIDRVVQWKLPTTFSSFIQRAGRAARGRGRTGTAILLVEKSAYSIDKVNVQASGANGKAGSTAKTRRKAAAASKPAPDGEPGGASSSVKREPKEAREYARSHGVGRGGTSHDDAPPNGQQPLLDPEDPDEGLLTFVQSVSCRRLVWAEVFESPAPTALTVPCCDICSPSLFDTCRPAVVSAERRAKTMRRGLPDTSAQDRLREWRLQIYTRDHPHAQFDESAILNDELIATLTLYGPLSADQLETLLRGKWTFWDEYRHEITRLFETMDITFTPIPLKPRAPPAHPSAPSASLAQTSATPIPPSRLPTPASQARAGVPRPTPPSPTLSMPAPSHPQHRDQAPINLRPRSSLPSSSLTAPVWLPQPTTTTSNAQPMLYDARSYTSTPSARPLPPRTQLTLSSTPFSQHAPSLAPPPFRAEYRSTSQSPQRHLSFQPHTLSVPPSPSALTYVKGSPTLRSVGPPRYGSGTFRPDLVAPPNQDYLPTPVERWPSMPSPVIIPAYSPHAGARLAGFQAEQPFVPPCPRFQMAPSNTALPSLVATPSKRPYPMEPERLEASPRNSPYGPYTPSPTKRPRLGSTAMATLPSTPSHIGHAASQRLDYAFDGELAQTHLAHSRSHLSAAMLDDHRHPSYTQAARLDHRNTSSLASATPPSQTMPNSGGLSLSWPDSVHPLLQNPDPAATSTPSLQSIDAVHSWPSHPGPPLSIPSAMSPMPSGSQHMNEEYFVDGFYGSY
ncbi:hypothetical protein C8Q73DRAFT_780555 [Cubamyces lactineus]|nr:hypothetical protein C8Q73DRAFT_780555 [Cubamyces lactineus]